MPHDAVFCSCGIFNYRVRQVSLPVKLAQEHTATARKTFSCLAIKKSIKQKKAKTRHQEVEVAPPECLSAPDIPISEKQSALSLPPV